MRKLNLKKSTKCRRLWCTEEEARHRCHSGNQGREHRKDEHDTGAWRIAELDS